MKIIRPFDVGNWLVYKESTRTKVFSKYLLCLFLYQAMQYVSDKQRGILQDSFTVGSTHILLKMSSCQDYLPFLRLHTVSLIYWFYFAYLFNT